jgi:hypothetical protein
MPFKVEWSLQCEPVPLTMASKASGANCESIKQLYRTGSLGPGPNVSAAVASIPLYHLASLLVLQDAEKKQIEREKVWKVLPIITGAAYVRFQLAEINAGRCDQRGGTPNLNRQLWSMLKSSGGQAMLESLLPGGAVHIKRYVGFTSQTSLAFDNIEEVGAQPETWNIIDSWEIASRLGHGLRGQFFSFRIA